MVYESLAYSTVTHLLVSRLSARAWMSLKQSMVLWMAPHRFAYSWYAFDVQIASKPSYTLFH